MPYQSVYVAPELFLEHRGVKVWRSYKDGEFELPYEHFFCLSEDEEHYSVSSPEFDARALPTYRATHPPFLPDGRRDRDLEARWRAWQRDCGALGDARAAILAAIDQGLIQQGTLFRCGALPGHGAADV